MNVLSENMKTLMNLALAYAEGKQFAIPSHIEDTPALLVPEGFKLQTFEEHRQSPLRIKQTVAADTVQSWLDYWNRFAKPHSTALFDLNAAKLMGILDYHQSSTDYDKPSFSFPDWLNHRVIYECPMTPEWKRWQEHSGKPLDQAAFARLIEDGVPDITDPTGAEMLEIATSLTVHNKVNFRQAIRLDNGETQFTYEENLEGQAGPKGQLKIPQTITLGIRLFEGGPGYAVEARFRYSIKDGKLSMWYDLVRPERVHEDAVLNIFQEIQQGMRVGHLLRGRMTAWPY